MPDNQTPQGTEVTPKQPETPCNCHTINYGGIGFWVGLLVLVLIIMLIIKKLFA